MFKNIKSILILKGILIGIGVLIPGVSGGALTLVFGLYERLISSVNVLINPQTITTFRAWIRKDQSPTLALEVSELKAHLSLLIVIGASALIGIFAFSQMITFAIEGYPKPTFFFFMGLILGSLPAVYRAHDSFSFSLSHAVAGALGFFIMIVMSFIPQGPELELTAGASLSLVQVVFLILSGAIAAGAMIIPGISASMISLLIGTYYHILAAISEFNFPVLLTVGVGAGLGFVLFTKAIHSFLKRYPIFSAYLIMGLVVGSMIKLWPGFSYDVWGLICLASGGIGIFIGRKLG